MRPVYRERDLSNASVTATGLIHTRDRFVSTGYDACKEVEPVAVAAADVEVGFFRERVLSAMRSVQSPACNHTYPCLSSETRICETRHVEIFLFIDLNL